MPLDWVMPQARVFLFRLALILLFWIGFSGIGAAQKFSGLTYQVPAGWTGQTGSGALLLTPAGLKAGELVTLRFLPPAPLSGEFKSWFDAHVVNNTRDLAGVQRSPMQADRTPDGDPALMMLVAGSLNGQARWRYFMAVLHAGKVVAVQYSVSSQALLTKYQPGLDAFLNSVSFTAPAPPSARSPTPAPTFSPAPSTAQFVASGHDPDKEPMPGEFRCYPELESGDYSRPFMTLHILPGGQYRLVGQGGVQIGQAGTYQPRKSSSSLNKLAWTSGVLTQGDEAYLDFNDYGQKIDLQNFGSEEKNFDFQCYQRGPREDLARLEFSLKTPKVGTYACQSRDGKGPPFPAEILPGNRYRVQGQEGQFRVDLLNKQDEDWSYLEFVGGAWDEGIGSFQEDETGKRTLSTARWAECSAVVAPTPIPRYGPGKAPPLPAGSGGLEGAYASWQPDVMGYGYCGGLCWDFYFFKKNGYVYTQEPDAGLEDADCTRTHPNGLPVCEVYTYKNGVLTIGKGKPEALKKKADGNLDLGGLTLVAIRPVSGVKLQGAFRNFTASVGLGGMTGSFSQAYLNFKADGTFNRNSSGGVSATFTDTGQSSGTITGGLTALGEQQNSGTYRFTGNTLELKYADGRVVRLFAFFPESAGGKPRLDFFRAGGRDYSLQTGK